MMQLVDAAVDGAEVDEPVNHVKVEIVEQGQQDAQAKPFLNTLFIYLFNKQTNNQKKKRTRKKEKKTKPCYIAKSNGFNK